MAGASREFIGRRVHSLMGLWLVVFLTEHLIVNSQAALWIGDDGHGFVLLVNFLDRKGGYFPVVCGSYRSVSAFEKIVGVFPSTIPAPASKYSYGAGLPKERSCPV